MRELSVETISQAVRELCIKANRVLPDDVKEQMQCALCRERDPLARSVLGDLVENFQQAQALSLPVCQDTGMAVVFLEIGQQVFLTGGDLTQAVNEGVRQGYLQGLLRCSVVGDPLSRENTGDNTPAVIHTQIVPGDTVKVLVAPKGFGSENMSSLKMFTPAAGPQEIISWVADCVCGAGGNPCPPVVVGVGIGGTFEYCAYLAKKALCRGLTSPNPNPFYADMERQILARLNETGVGPQGFGGDTTCLGVCIETYPTHIAGLPVAVNMGCHVTRHAQIVL